MVSAEISYHTPAMEAAPPRLTLADCFVVIAIGLVATAVAAGLMAHYSVGLVVAAAVASLSFVAMMAGHIGVRRAGRRDHDHYSSDEDVGADADAAVAARRALSDGAALQSQLDVPGADNGRPKDIRPSAAPAVNDTLLTSKQAAEPTATAAACPT